MLKHRNIKTVTQPPQKIKHLILSMKDPQGLEVPGIYWIPCSCRLLYAGQTARMIAIREKKRKRHLRLGNTEKSVLTLHGWETGHSICFDRTTLLHRSSNWHETVVRESLELGPNKRFYHEQRRGSLVSG